MQTDLDGIVDSSSASSSNDSSQKALLHCQSKRLAPSLVLSHCSGGVGVLTGREGIVSHAEDLGEIEEGIRREQNEQLTTSLPFRNCGATAENRLKAEHVGGTLYREQEGIKAIHKI